MTLYIPVMERLCNAHLTAQYAMPTTIIPTGIHMKTRGGLTSFSASKPPCPGSARSLRIYDSVTSENRELGHMQYNMMAPKRPSERALFTSLRRSDSRPQLRFVF
jgi:hypothetical protein